MKRYYLLAFANFLAALGGGAILSSGFKSLKDSFPNGPIVAFFIGIAIGLCFQLLVSPRWSKTIAPWFSVGVGPLSLILAWLFNAYADGEALRGGAAFFFVALLSVRFGLWFFSRALRAQAAGRRRQGVALIELGYYSGMVLGLVFQESFKYGMFAALLIDSVLQPLAGLIDLTNANGRTEPESCTADASTAEEPVNNDAPAGAIDVLPFDRGLYWRLTAAVVCLTIGFQAVPFSIEHPDDGMKTYVFACFYGAVALAALFCITFQIKFDWGGRRGRVGGGATISSECDGIWPKASFGLITLAAAVTMVTAVSASGMGLKSNRLELIFLAASAFIYQVLVLSLLDGIGRAESFGRVEEGVKLTYLILGVSTVMSIFVLSQASNTNPARVIVTVACSLIAFYAVRRGAEHAHA